MARVRRALERAIAVRGEFRRELILDGLAHDRQHLRNHEHVRDVLLGQHADDVWTAPVGI